MAVPGIISHAPPDGATVDALLERVADELDLVGVEHARFLRSLRAFVGQWTGEAAPEEREWSPEFCEVHMRPRGRCYRECWVGLEQYREVPS